MNFLDERLPERFWNKVIPEPNSGCWLWLGANNHEGYGRFNLLGCAWYSHRLTYLMEHGDLGEDLDVDHLCRTPACCNPSHLEAVTHRENILRGTGFAAKAAKAAHCPSGHEYSDGNTYVSPKGHRKCRACHREESNARYHRQRAA